MKCRHSTDVKPPVEPKPHPPNSTTPSTSVTKQQASPVTNESRMLQLVCAKVNVTHHMISLITQHGDQGAPQEDLHFDVACCLRDIICVAVRVCACMCVCVFLYVPSIQQKHVFHCLCGWVCYPKIVFFGLYPIVSCHMYTYVGMWSKTTCLVSYQS